MFILWTLTWINFNPRSREGSDILQRLTQPNIKDFNPRSREGSDIPRVNVLHFARDFNPRSREGSDGRVHYMGVFDYISIHAPARGATSSIDCNGVSSSNFNPRSREGSDGR